MNESKKKKFTKVKGGINAKNRNSGITLIALVVTIIVLLILAGISISMLAGDNGLLTKATDAKESSGKAEVIENAKLDVLAQIAENKGENISKDQLKTILSKYFENISTLELPDDLSNSDIKLNANQVYGKYKNITLSDIYNGAFSSTLYTSTNESQKIKAYFESSASYDEYGDNIDNDLIGVKVADLQNVGSDDNNAIDYYMYKNGLYIIEWLYDDDDNFIGANVTKQEIDLTTFGEKTTTYGTKILVTPITPNNLIHIKYYYDRYEDEEGNHFNGYLASDEDISRIYNNSGDYIPGAHRFTSQENSGPDEQP